MKFTIETSQIRDAVKFATQAIPAKAIKPELACVSITAKNKSCTVASTDLELGIRIELPEADVTTDGQVLIDAQRLNAILSAASDMVTIHESGEKIVIQSGMSKYELARIDPAGYPDVITEEKGAAFVVKASDLDSVIHACSHAVSHEIQSYSMTGILVNLCKDKINAVATDGRRLVVAGKTIDSVESSAIVPGRACNLIERVIHAQPDEDCGVVVGRKFTIRCRNYLVQTVLVEGKFPDYKGVLPKPSEFTAEFTTTAGELADGIRRATAVSDDMHRVTMKSNNADIHFRSKTETGYGTSVIKPVLPTSGPIEIDLNWKYLIEAMKTLDHSQEVVFHFCSHQKPALITCDDYRYLLMPLS